MRSLMIFIRLDLP